MFLKFLIMADEVYYKMNGLLNRLRKADIRLKPDFLPYRINKETLLVDTSIMLYCLPILQLVKK